MRKISLMIAVELEVPDVHPDELVYEAICNQFAGTNGDGLRQYPGSGILVASKHRIEILKMTEVWGSSL